MTTRQGGRILSLTLQNGKSREAGGRLWLRGTGKWGLGRDGHESRDGETKLWTDWTPGRVALSGQFMVGEFKTPQSFCQKWC